MTTPFARRDHLDLIERAAIGTVRLEDGTEVKAFVCQPRALDGATEIRSFGGWRAALADSAGQ